LRRKRKFEKRRKRPKSWGRRSDKMENGADTWGLGFGRDMVLREEGKGRRGRRRKKGIEKTARRGGDLGPKTKKNCLVNQQQDM